MLVAYEGNQPYIFISYSHRNSRYIHSVIEFLQNSGYRVWFDGGIEAGSEWPEYIASHLEGCSCVLTFMSNAFVASDNCKRELHFAQDLKKPLLNVYIEEVNLPAGLRMQLGLCQAMYRDNFRTEGEFLNSLARARIMADCRDKSVEAVVMDKTPVESDGKDQDAVWSGDAIPSEENDDAALVEFDQDLKKYEDEIEDLTEDEEEEEDEPAEEIPPLSGGMKLLGWFMILLELSYCAIGPAFLDLFTSREMGVWKMIMLYALPHIALAVLNSMLSKVMVGRTHPSQRDYFTVPLFFLSVLTGVVAAIVGISRVHYDLAGFVRFLIALGLNIIPAAAAFVIYAVAMVSDKKD